MTNACQEISISLKLNSLNIFVEYFHLESHVTWASHAYTVVSFHDNDGNSEQQVVAGDFETTKNSNRYM